MLAVALSCAAGGAGRRRRNDHPAVHARRVARRASARAPTASAQRAQRGRGRVHELRRADPPGAARRGRPRRRGGRAKARGCRRRWPPRRPSSRRSRTPRSGGSAPVQVGGQVVHPGVVHAEHRLGAQLAAEPAARDRSRSCSPAWRWSPGASLRNRVRGDASRLSARPRAGACACPRRSWSAGAAARPARGRGSLAPAVARARSLVAGVLCFVTFFAKGGLSLESMTDDRDRADARRRGRDRRRRCCRRAQARLRAVEPRPAARPHGAHRRCRSCGRCSPTRAGRTRGGCSPTAACSPRRSRSCAWRRGRWPAILGGVTLAAVVVCGYALLTKVFPGDARAAEHLRAPGGTLRLLERDRPDGRDGRDRLHVARRAAQRATRCSARWPTRRWASLLLTLLLAYSRGALVALAIGAARCGSASCRCACAARPC